MMEKRRISLGAGILIGLTLIQLTNALVECPNGWAYKYGLCWKFFSARLSYDDANSICSNYGGHLAVVNDFHIKASYIKDLVLSVDSTATTWWQGVRRENHANFMTADDRTMMREIGFYGNEEVHTLPPNTKECLVMSREENSYLFPTVFGSRFGPCSSTYPFVCSRNSCPIGQTFCVNGKCIPFVYRCNGFDECGDFTDESNCPQRNTYVFTGTSGNIVANNYADFDAYQWRIEVNIHLGITLTFSALETELDSDVVEVWCGGRSLIKSKMLARLSGPSPPPNAFPCASPFMIVVFYSDYSIDFTGVTASWTTAPRVSPPMDYTATSVPQSLINLNIPGGIRQDFNIDSGTQLKIITLKMIALQLPPGGKLVVIDGNYEGDKILYTYSAGEEMHWDNAPYIQSSHRNMMLQLTTPIALGSGYYHFEYTNECHVELEGEYAILENAGRFGVSNYPNVLTCTYIVNSGNSKNLNYAIIQDIDPSDTIKIYEWNVTGIVLYETGGSLPLKGSSSSTQIMVEFQSNAGHNGQGFRISISRGCDVPEFNMVTLNVVIGSPPYQIGDSIAIQCPTGYSLAQEEFQIYLQGTGRVIMTCMNSGWDVKSTPNCMPMHCGIPSPIVNGFVASSLENSAIYQGKVKYSCKNGFGLISGVDTSTCGTNGIWSALPVCGNSQCKVLPTTLNNGDIEKVYTPPGGTVGNERGTVFKYNCNSGYIIIGDPYRVCDSGTWRMSDDPPVCTRVTCKVEKLLFPHSASAWPQTSGTDAQSTLTVVCEAGYEVVGQATMMCQDDGTFNIRPVCVDQDECSGTNPCTNAECIDMIGSFKCKCMPGYETSTSTFCSDINECQDSPCHPSPVGGCQNTPAGSYTCSCSNSDYELFMGTSTAGFNVPQDETVDHFNNTYRDKHTCVKKQCTYTPDGTRQNLKPKQVYSVGDTIHFECVVGFDTLPNPTSTCTSTGWSPTLPTCQAAKCNLQADFSQSSTFRPTFADSTGKTISELNYGETVTITCPKSRSTPVIHTRICRYLQKTNSYGINPDNNDNEEPFLCPVDTCSDFTAFPVGNGVLVLASGEANKYGSLYDVQCTSPSSLTGVSAQTNTKQVACSDFGVWKGGDLNCPAAQCSNPLSVPKATQVITNSYIIGSKVMYTCPDEDNYDLLPSTFTFFTCLPSLAWSPSTVPLRCRWNKKPVFTGCDQSVLDMDIPIYTTPSIPLLTATADGGKSTLVDIAFTELSQQTTYKYVVGFPLGNALSVTYVAHTADSIAPLQETCPFTIRVHELVPPIISCPVSSVYYFTSSSPATEMVTHAGQATASDAVVTYSPETFSANSKGIVKVTATATKEYGSGANLKDVVTSCSYTIETILSCADLDFSTINEFTDVECTAGTCTISCNSGTYFRDGTTTTQVDKTYICQNNGQWHPTGPIPGCVPAVAARSIISALVSYKNSADNNDIVANCITKYENDFKNRVSSEFQANSCQMFYNTNPVIDITSVSGANSPKNRLVISFTIELKALDPTKDLIPGCLGTLKTGFQFEPSAHFINVLQAAGCSQVLKTTGQTELPPSSTNIMDPVSQCSQSQEAVSTDLCVQCGPGQYIKSGACVPCDKGSYNAFSAATSCVACSPGTSTRTPGSTRIEDCIFTCLSQRTSLLFAGVSTNGVTPCNECPQNNYINPTNVNTRCMTCPSKTSTETIGAIAETECIAECPAGQYSPSGYDFTASRCQPCPRGGYKLAGAGRCIACQDGRTTPTTGSTAVSDCTSSPTCNPSCISSNGACAIYGNIPYCRCNKGFSGNRCQISVNLCPIDECGAGTCQRDTSDAKGYSCICPQKFTGSKCENNGNCDANTCGPNGKCQETDEVPYYKCVCNTQASGPTCQQQADPCATDTNPCTSSNTVQCSALGSIPVRKICQCKAGYTGDLCEININECASNPCRNGGSCKDLVDGYQCDCDTTMYQGGECEIHTAVCTQTNVACSGGTCIINHRTGTELCTCVGFLAPDPLPSPPPWYSIFTQVALSCKTIDVCNGKPADICKHGSSCSNTNLPGDGYSCGNCPAGYRGKHCQINNDDCATTPCANGGICTDAVNAFTCNCTQTGYEGTTCNQPINECQGNDCKDPGTLQCIEDSPIVGQFMCQCNPGYAGYKCETEISECASDPCQHGGTCMEEINSYRCMCKDGWQGIHCEMVIPMCQPNPCGNGADCTGLVGISYCHCSNDNFGPTCTGVSNICTDVSNICQPGSTCTPKGEDDVTCSCNANRTGEYCELEIEPCKPGRNCANSGICSVPNLDEHVCECRAGTTGLTCADAQNTCNGITCSNGGSCIARPDGTHCACTSNYDGPSCGKPVDLNYDICFKEEKRNSYAAGRYPFAFKPSNFSVGAWVRYDTDSCTGDREGKVLTLFTSRFPYNDASDEYADKVRLLVIDHEKLTTYFNGGHPLSLPYQINNQPFTINNGNWIYMLITYNGVSEDLIIYANSLKVQQSSVNAISDLLDYGWLTLGSNEGASMQGCVNQVMVWDRSLTYEEVVQLTSSPAITRPNPSTLLTAGLSVGIVSNWKRWNLGPGTRLVSPSEAGTPPADGQMEEEQCLPVFTNCPDVPITVQGESDPTVVTWPDLIVNAVSLSCKYNSGSAFTWGLYTNVCVAKNTQGFSTKCVFDIAVRKLDCGDPSIGASTTLMCSQAAIPALTSRIASYDVRVCTVNCPGGATESVTQPKSYMCDAMGTFDVHSLFSPGVIPACGENTGTKALYNIVITLRYPDVQTCEALLAIDAIVTSIRGKISILNALTTWGPINSNNALCSDNACNDVSIIQTCTSPSVKRRRRRAITHTVPEVRIVLDNTRQGNIIYRGTTVMFFQDILELLSELFIDLSLADVNGAMADPLSFTFAKYAVCSSGTGLLNNLCVQCNIGTYAPLTSNSCLICPKGTYQNLKGQTSCVGCPNGQTTDLPGANSDSMCIESCLKGSVYSLILLRCETCTLGSYMDEVGQTRSCKSCGASRTTLVIGATSELQCKDTCVDGYELNAIKQCVKCRKGTYRKQGIDMRCINCQAGYTTASDAASDENQCTIPDCLAGSMIDGGACVACIIGYWQDQPGKNSCIPCGPNYITEHVGAQLESQCILSCPKGSEMSVPDQCLPCPRGFWKDTYGVNDTCIQCPLGMTTSGIGTIMMADCNVKVCSLGHYVDGNTCQPCVADQYQDEPWMTTCKTCPGGTDTGSLTGSTHADECKLTCLAGYSGRGTLNCLACPHGTFKPKQGSENCTDCPDGKTTPGTASTDELQCDRDACDPGNYLDGLMCKPCPSGTYQPQQLQHTCVNCAPGLTTLGPGKTATQDCIQNCENGYGYNLVTQSCILCPRGTYRTKDVEDMCTDCTGAYTTPNIGSLSQADCTIRACGKGSFWDLADKLCRQCTLGYYQEFLSAESCVPCPFGKTTFIMGATSGNDCKLICNAGLHWSEDDAACVKCPYGYYRGILDGYRCIKCPVGTTTDYEGATTGGACTRNNCPAGNFDNRNGLCIRCHKGTYQPSSGQTQCIPCIPPLTTISTGATNDTDCKPGVQCVEDCIVQSAGGKCVQTVQGYTCVCRTGWSGIHPNCSHPCSSGQLCNSRQDCYLDANGSPFCKCRNGSVGCADDFGAADSFNMAVVLGASVGGGVVLILLIAIVCVACGGFRSCMGSNKGAYSRHRNRSPTPSIQGFANMGPPDPNDPVRMSFVSPVVRYQSNYQLENNPNILSLNTADKAPTIINVSNGQFVAPAPVAPATAFTYGYANANESTAYGNFNQNPASPYLFHEDTDEQIQAYGNVSARNGVMNFI